MGLRFLLCGVVFLVGDVWVLSVGSGFCRWGCVFVQWVVVFGVWGLIFCRLGMVFCKWGFGCFGRWGWGFGWSTFVVG